MSTGTSLVVRTGRVTVRAVLPTFFANLVLAVTAHL